MLSADDNGLEYNVSGYAAGFRTVDLNTLKELIEIV
jgi:hypothetical protein